MTFGNSHNDKPLETGHIRVVGYARVSTAQQAGEGVSLDAQKTKMSAYCSALDLELVAVVEDAGQSAGSLQRPGLQKVLRMLEAGRASAILVTKLDRLTRSVRDLGQLVETYFATGRASLLSVSDSIDTRSPSGRLVMNLIMSVAQWEREAISDRTKEAMAQLKAEGVELGWPSFGLRRGAPDRSGRRRFEPDPEQQRTLRQILLWQETGVSVPKIVERLNEQGLRTARGDRWHRTMVYRLLRREGRIPEVLRAPRRRSQSKPAEHDREKTIAVASALRSRGLSLREIAEVLLAQNLPPPKGARWHASSLSAMLGYERP